MTTPLTALERDLLACVERFEPRHARALQIARFAMLHYGKSDCRPLQLVTHMSPKSQAYKLVLYVTKDGNAPFEG